MSSGFSPEQLDGTSYDTPTGRVEYGWSGFGGLFRTLRECFAYGNTMCSYRELCRYNVYTRRSS